jgi:hypothetical protein
MSLLGNVEIKTTELPDALEFTVVREDGLIETIAIPIFAFFVLWMLWRTGNLWLRTIAGFAAGFTSLVFVANWIQGGETKLRVTRDRLVAEGNLGQLRRSSVTIATRDVKSIRFDDGGDGGISGLYVRHGWRFTPVLPRLSLEQSQTVVDAIRKKFPEIPAEKNVKPFSLSSLFRGGAQLTTGDRSKSGVENPDRQE